MKLNSAEKIEELLQEIYFEADKSIVEITDDLNKVKNAIDNLNNESTDGIQKYTKSLKDLLDAKDKALSRKLEIAKLMAEILKANGNIAKAVEAIDPKAMDWDAIKSVFYNEENKDGVETYNLKGPRH